MSQIAIEIGSYSIKKISPIKKKKIIINKENGA